MATSTAAALALETDVDPCAEAIRYQALGWALLPIGANKEPYFDLLPKGKNGKPSWKLLAKDLATPDDIRHWYEHDPACNIGLITGDASGGIAVADFDQPVPAGIRFAPTPQATTARGSHIYFRVPLGTKSRKFAWGELLANGNYVVLPPSVHPSGVRYVWESYLSPLDVDPAPLPAEFTSASPLTSGRRVIQFRPRVQAKKWRYPGQSTPHLAQVRDRSFRHGFGRPTRLPR